MILALVVVPLCTGLVMSVRMNAKADALLQAQLAVSSEIEKLMATGIDGVPETENDHIVIEVVHDGSSPYYNVTVQSIEHESVRVETVIREGGGSE